jgi:hypothetical protein
LEGDGGSFLWEEIGRDRFQIIDARKCLQYCMKDLFSVSTTNFGFGINKDKIL